MEYLIIIIINKYKYISNFISNQRINKIYILKKK